MLDIGSWEFLIIIVIALIVIGPRDLPGVVKSVGMWVRRAKDLAREFQSGLEDMARETELDKVKNEIENEIAPHDITNKIRNDIETAVDSDGKLREAFDEDEWLDGHLGADDLGEYEDSSKRDGKPSDGSGAPVQGPPMPAESEGPREATGEKVADAPPGPDPNKASA